MATNVGHEIRLQFDSSTALYVLPAYITNKKLGCHEEYPRQLKVILPEPLGQGVAVIFCRSDRLCCQIRQPFVKWLQ